MSARFPVYLISGRDLDLEDPRPEQVHLTDVAHNLGKICRFNGSVEGHYSVAEHCVRVYRRVLRQLSDSDNAHISFVPADAVLKAALLHDAHEFVWGDTIYPVKMLIYTPEVKAMVRKLDEVIAEKYIGIDASIFDHQLIKVADANLSDAEAHRFIPRRRGNHAEIPNLPDDELMDLSCQLVGWERQMAEDKFLECLEELGIED